MNLRESHILLFNIFLAGLCSIIYELLIATTSSYFLGDSITQFSITIGVYMATMGVGSYLSKFVPDQHLLSMFVAFELCLALVGGASVPLLYLSYSEGLPFQFVTILLTGVIGVLVGLEIPLLSRLLERHYTLKVNLANVLSIDYLGALLATLVFPFFLLPQLGVFKSSVFFGLVNLLIALTLIWWFKDHFSKGASRYLKSFLALSGITLVLIMVFSKQLTQLWMQDIFEHRIVHAEQSEYQQLVVTKHKADIRLYLNGNIQFSSIDEHRYHESLIHPVMARLPNVQRVLLLGAGDGLAVKQLLEYANIEHIQLVDLDPAVTDLASRHHYLNALNNHSLSHEKVTIIHQDAFEFLQHNDTKYDLIVIDLPDPKSIALARLYSTQFYYEVVQSLNPYGAMVTQASSPFFSQKAFWSIHKSVAKGGFYKSLPYHVNVPSFGEWGFVMGCNFNCQNVVHRPFDGRFYNAKIDPWLFEFPTDLVDKDVDLNSLDDPVLLDYYLAGWRYWN